MAGCAENATPEASSAAAAKAVRDVLRFIRNSIPWILQLDPVR
jgi:hypothetical protein